MPSLFFLPNPFFRFKQVSIPWKDHLSNPFFAHLQSNYFHDMSGFFCQSLSHESPTFFLPIDPKSHGVPDQHLSFLPERVDVRTSCNGILCCQGRRNDKAYYLCNPVTQKWRKLPRHSADHGCDPAIVLTIESSPDFLTEYKIVCAFQSPHGCEFEVYFSAEGRWRISGDIHFGNRKPISASGISVNGIVYWRTNQLYHLTFDLMTERSKLLFGGTHMGTLGVIDGKLCTTFIDGRVLVVKVLSNPYTNTMPIDSEVKTWEDKMRIRLPKSVRKDSTLSAWKKFEEYDYGRVVSASGN
ncbi:F-box protein [Quillaja saponaria]|uniref:F-box protein n=1 Tax=Quillaja saponaria TaxID=32244 RepID=A0AAD7KPV9_QUISA|nr:F-box protein [Quillaja saponaria]